ncbi:hypothetical protein [Sorangium cellulosum]|uniref:hypothetical protein n=1 Tax=Sorangium cellulosum TaxID=56 RepID=UPI0007C55DB0|nr:hypothetical protein [Sorangium cellulosum]
MLQRVLVLVSVGLLSACSGADPGAAPEPPLLCKASPDCAPAPETPLCDQVRGECVALPPGAPIGVKDGSPSSVALALVHEQDRQREPTDLDFNPERPEELWVVNRQDDSVIIVTRPGAPDSASIRLRDPAAAHFMDRPPAIDFGDAGTFGVCGDNDNGGNDFMGPTLFSSDLAVFAKSTPDGLGSHLDMLHSSPFCKGIAHEAGNVYWVFNGHDLALDRYDFAHDHGPGNDDHADGAILRYAAGEVLGTDDAPSHVFYRAEDRHLYVADTGHGRLLKLDTASGTPGASFDGQEPVRARKHVDGATLTELVPPGTLEAPSGIEVHEGIVYATDHATSRFYAFDLTGRLVRTLDTGLPAGSLAGFTFGPDGKLYFVDLRSSRVYRIDPIL